MDKQKMTAFVGGEIVSVDADNKMTIYEAMLVQGDTIAYLGDREGLKKLISESTQYGEDSKGALRTGLEAVYGADSKTDSQAYDAGNPDFSEDFAKAAGRLEVIDLNGRSILPGFTDSHLHASSMTELVFDADILIGQPGMMFPREEALAKYRKLLSESVMKNPDNPVYRGAGWDPGIFMGSPEGFPTAEDLDGIADDKPVLLR